MIGSMTHLALLLGAMAVRVCVCASTPNCSYQGLLQHLGLSENINTTLSHIRPVRNWSSPTNVYVNLYLQGIIEVNEKLQSISHQVYLVVGWVNEFTIWDPAEFCGIKRISVPKEKLWMPDLTITENIETEAGMKESPYAQLLPHGIVYASDSYKMTSSCKMDLHKFPFDTQRCTITLISYIYTIEELRLFSSYNSSTVTENSRKMFQSQGEWELVSVDISRVNLTIGRFVWDQVVYTFIIRRRPLLYIVIFVVPVFYFLILDLASFLISGSGGEKLSFKVTVLLAISVLLLILHDMLPSTDENTPLIGIYCLGIFTFVAVSLLETICVSFLMRLATHRGWRAVTDTPEDTRNCQQGVDILSVVQVCEDNQLSSTRLLHQILQELRFQRQHAGSDDKHLPEARSVCVKRLAKYINVAYFFCYLLSITVFLLVTGCKWLY